MIKGYLIFESETRADLIEQINAAIREKGWTPQGGVSAAFSHGRMIPRMMFYQAMIKEEE
jgi:hypothetical protein